MAGSMEASGDSIQDVFERYTLICKQRDRERQRPTIGWGVSERQTDRDSQRHTKHIDTGPALGFENSRSTPSDTPPLRPHFLTLL